MSNEKREQEMMAAAEAYAESVGYKDENDLCATLNVFCGGWRAADQHPRWIPVEKSKPEGRGHYLVYSEYGDVWLSEWMQDNEGRWDWYVAPICVGIISKVTHWMPLPTPPQGKEANNE
jgi:hypothetical protein